MEHFKGEALPENVRCLANHKLRARILKNSMMRDRMNRNQDSLGAKIIKYETFLSQNMLQNIKTQELIQFQQQVQQFCSKKKSIGAVKSQTAERCLNMHSIFDQIKKEVKVKQKAKRRSKTYENSQTNFLVFPKPTQLIQRENNEYEQSNSSQFVRDHIDRSEQLRIKQKHLSLKGKIVSSSLVGIMEKMEDMKYLCQKSGRKLGTLIQLQSPIQLKQQKQRLNTASEGNQRVKFVPIGKRSEQNKKVYHSQEKLFISHMPQIVNKNPQEKKQMRKSINGHKKIGQLRKSTLKLENEIGLKFKKTRKSAHFSHIDRLSEYQNDQMNEINCF